MFLIPPFN